MVTDEFHNNGKEKICIVGSGLVGSLLSILLTQLGFDIDIFDKRKDPRQDTLTRGRTIAMSISARGWKALKQAGIYDEVRKNANPKHSRMVHLCDGTIQTYKYGDGTQAINTINRKYLNITLINAAMATGKVNIYFEHECVNLNPDTGDIFLKDIKTDQSIQKNYTRIFGTDGIFSNVCELLTNKGLLNFTRTTLSYGYKELQIPANQLGDFALHGNSLHSWPRKDGVLVAFPTIEKEFVCTLFLPLDGENSLAAINSEATLMQYFNSNFPDVIPLMPNLKEDYFKNPASTLTTVNGSPWNYKDKVLLIGDASHAILPFYGMGMNIGFEDCTFFINLLKKNNLDFTRTFEMYSPLRKPDTDAMAELSFNNFNSIGASPDHTYQLKWELERKIWELFTGKWTPSYVLIAFTHTPLAKVIKIKERQDKILDDIVRSHDNIANLSGNCLKETIENYLSELSPVEVVT
ncbi:MAG: NAD(P)/FAD-dependent oxidoreductase [Ignavibacteriales bacterium]|nr:NAD(P)/FAD-dependent oxidoreductase [Ignavibacteriales bacterium]